jgi:hypothetical protein
VIESCSELTNKHPAGGLVAAWNRHLEPPPGTEDNEGVEREGQSIYPRSDGRTELCRRTKAIAEKEYGIIAKSIAGDQVCHTTVCTI